MGRLLGYVSLTVEQWESSALRIMLNFDEASERLSVIGLD